MKTLICAAMASVPGMSIEAARSSRDSFISFTILSAPASPVMRTSDLISLSRSFHASEKEDVAESSACRLGSRRFAICLTWVVDGGELFGTSANSLVIAAPKDLMASSKVRVRSWNMGR